MEKGLVEPGSSLVTESTGDKGHYVGRKDIPGR